MRVSYEIWAAGKLRVKARCRVEGSMSCIPLRSDPICLGCYESDMEEMRRSKASLEDPGGHDNP
jgi:hypothetical protein